MVPLTSSTPRKILLDKLVAHELTSLVAAFSRSLNAYAVQYLRAHREPVEDVVTERTGGSILKKIGRRWDRHLFWDVGCYNELYDVGIQSVLKDSLQDPVTLPLHLLRS